MYGKVEYVLVEIIIIIFLNHLCHSVSCLFRVVFSYLGSSSDSSKLIPREPKDGGAWWAAVHGVARSRT